MDISRAGFQKRGVVFIFHSGASTNRPFVIVTLSAIDIGCLHVHVDSKYQEIRRTFTDF